MSYLGRMMGVVLVGALCAAILVVDVRPIHSQLQPVFFVTNVNDDGDGSLRKAIMDANGSSVIDLIIITVTGQLNLASALPTITDAVTIDGPGEGFIVDGQNLYRGFTIANVPVTIEGLTVQHAVAFGNLPGGGIVSEGDLMLSHVNVLYSNAGGSGGGVSSTGSIVVNSGHFEGNKSGNYGGGLYAGGTLTLTDTQIISNSAQYFGGGVYAADALQVSNSLFISNTAIFRGGGGIALNGAAVLTNVRFENNRSVTWPESWGGGGLLMLDYVPVTLTNVDFVGNYAANTGGGLLAVGPGGPASAPNILINGGRFERNQAQYEPGGGMRANNVVLTNTLFISNTAYQGAGAQVLRFVAVGGSFAHNQGGGLVADRMELTGTDFVANIGGYGGAFVRAGGKAINVRFADNRSGALFGGAGGGLTVTGPTTLSGTHFINNIGIVGGGLRATGDITVTLTQFLGNSARLGGGLAHGSGDATLVNTLFARNTASEGGAALALQGTGTDIIRHVTIASSALVTTTAITTSKAIVLFQNNIVANHAVGLGVSDGFVTLSNNLFHNNGTDIAGSVAVESDRAIGDPLFVNPGADDYHLQVGSPAMDAGRDVGITSDVDGDVRPALNGFDIGYDEVVDIPVSTATPMPTQVPAPAPTASVTPKPTATRTADDGATHPLHLPSLHR